tara:strand:- start:39 stop:995 length:957 start_codon:yes stop_codon:yes gene_type:complete
MATSGTTTFESSFFIDDIITEAYERIGMFDYSGNNIKTARRSLNILFQEWANRGLHYWEVANKSIELVSGQSEYTLFRSRNDGNSDGINFTTGLATINASDTTIQTNLTSQGQIPSSGILNIGSELIFYPLNSIVFNAGILQFQGVTRGHNNTTAATYLGGTAVNTFVGGVDDILEAVYRTSDSVDFPLTKINRSGYQGLSNKTQTGTPTQYWVQRFIDKVTITLYLTPGSTEAGNFLNYYYVKRIQDAGAYTNEADVPYRFVPCMVAGLTYYLSQKFAPQRTQELKLLYEDELKRALEEDGSASSSFITPKTYYEGL